jgi:hypothetical protein
MYPARYDLVLSTNLNDEKFADSMQSEIYPWLLSESTLTGEVSIWTLPLTPST